MNSHLSYTLSSLANWTDQLIDDARKIDSVSSLRTSTGTKDYLKFYESLLPFINQLNEIKNELIPVFIADFRSNYARFQEELSPRGGSLFGLFNWSIDDDDNDRSTREALLVLTAIKGNCEDIIYQLSIHQP